jgi:dipeptidyl aminopeptidase/acylaminoacyl peptidase
VLVSYYNGPNSQFVENKYKSNWYRVVQSSEEIIVAMIDGRGTGARGSKFKYSVYKNLGEYEVEDQYTLIKWLHTQPYVNSKLIAVQGWVRPNN